MYNIYTDLADEARELHPEIEGITEESEESDGIKTVRIKVESEDAARMIEKGRGRYISIDAPTLAERPLDLFTRVSQALSKELRALFPEPGLRADSSILVVGLGNRNVTPDALGPRTVEQVYVTRHVSEYMPDAFSHPVCSVAAVSPGVLGVTGIETMEIVRGVVEHVKPDLILVIDSLASRRAARISTTVQLTDTGICPGSGVGNAREGINQESFQIPVIALGIPMVVHASTITQDALSMMADETGMHQDEDQLKELAAKVIEKNIGEMIVTPKDIDAIITDMSRILADGINMALFDADYQEVRALIA